MASSRRISRSAATCGSAATETRFSVRVTRAEVTPGKEESARPTSELQTAQWAVGRDRGIPAWAPAARAAKSSAAGAATQAGQAEIEGAAADMDQPVTKRSSRW